MQHRELSSSRLRFTAFETGSAGVPVVLLHGAGSNAMSWAGLMCRLEPRRILALDLPSHGRSDAALSWDLHETAEQVYEAVRTALGGEPAIFGGHSWGGKLSGLIAAAHPDACRGLILVDPSPSHAVPVDCAAFVEASFGIELGSFESPDAAVEAARAALQYRNWSNDLSATIRYGLEQRADGSWSLRPTRDELRLLAEGVLWSDCSEELAKNRDVPALLVTSDQSVWQVMTNRAVYDRAEQVEIAGSHWIHHDDPEAVAAVVGRWLDEKFPLS